MSRDELDDPSYAVPTEDAGSQAFAHGSGVVHIGEMVGGSINVVSPTPQQTKADRLAEQRQKFFFDFLKHSLQQAEWTFRLSVWFMTGGAAIILTAAVLGLVHAGNPDLNYLPIVTFLTGALITGGGGALAIHSQRARAHVTEQADRMDVKIDLDHKMETATTFIDRVDDPVVRDRLNSAAAMKALDMQRARKSWPTASCRSRRTGRPARLVPAVQAGNQREATDSPPAAQRRPAGLGVGLRSVGYFMRGPAACGCRRGGGRCTGAPGGFLRRTARAGLWSVGTRGVGPRSRDAGRVCTQGT